MSGTQLGANSFNEKQPNFHLFYVASFLLGLVMNKDKQFPKNFLKKLSRMKVKYPDAMDIGQMHQKAAFSPTLGS